MQPKSKGSKIQAIMNQFYGKDAQRAFYKPKNTSNGTDLLSMTLPRSKSNKLQNTNNPK